MSLRRFSSAAFGCSTAINTLISIRPLAFATAASLALLGASAVHAADLAIDAEPAPIEALDPTFTWSGAYAGATAGYVFGKDRTIEYAGGGYIQQFALKPDGWTASVMGGYNFDYNGFVVGIEADGGFADVHDSFVDPPGAPPFVGDPGATGDVDINWQASARLRAGYAFDRTLVFVTGGWAVAGMTYEFSNLTTGVREPFKDTRHSYTVGAGIEYAITDMVIGRIEYRYTPFSHTSYNSVTAFPGLSITALQNPSLNEIRTGVSVKF
jgi:outer membrane immunogenic protein